MYSRSILNAIRIALMLICAATGATPARAQTPTSTPAPSEEELRLQEEKRLTELRRDIEKAKKEIRDAQPQPAAPTSTPLAGDTTLENAKLEAEMVSYKALSEAAFAISQEIKKAKKDAKNFAIYDAQIVKDWRFYKALAPAFEGQIADLKSQYKKLLCETATITPYVSDSFKTDQCNAVVPTREFARGVVDIQSAFGAGTTLIKSFIDLAALFRTDTKIQGLAFTADESALVAEIFRALKKEYSDPNKPITLFYPEVFPPRVTDTSETVTIIGDLFLYKIEADSVIRQINAEKEKNEKQMVEPSEKKSKAEEERSNLKGMRERLETLEANLKTTKDPAVRRRIRAEIAKLRTGLSKLVKPDVTLGETLDEALDRRLKELDEAIEGFDKTLESFKAKIKQLNADAKALLKINESFLSFVDEFVKVDDKGINALMLFIRSEDIENALKDKESYWLEVKSISAGGNNRIRKNLLRFFAGAKVDHSGGIIVEYTLYEKSGAVVYSDKLSVYEGYFEPKKIRTLKDKVETLYP